METSGALLVWDARETRGHAKKLMKTNYLRDILTVLTPGMDWRRR